MARNVLALLVCVALVCGPSLTGARVVYGNCAERVLETLTMICRAPDGMACFKGGLSRAASGGLLTDALDADDDQASNGWPREENVYDYQAPLKKRGQEGILEKCCKYGCSFEYFKAFCCDEL